MEDKCSDVNCHCGSPVRQEIFHKSSKEFYKAVAAQCGGLPCKMTENCRCLECQVLITFSFLISEIKLI